MLHMFFLKISESIVLILLYAESTQSAQISQNELQVCYTCLVLAVDKCKLLQNVYLKRTLFFLLWNLFPVNILYIQFQFQYLLYNCKLKVLEKVRVLLKLSSPSWVLARLAKGRRSKLLSTSCCQHGSFMFNLEQGLLLLSEQRASISLLLCSLFLLQQSFVSLCFSQKHGNSLFFSCCLFFYLLQKSQFLACFLSKGLVCVFFLYCNESLETLFPCLEEDHKCPFFDFKSVLGVHS